MIFKSIKWRLQLWHGLILLLVLVGFGLTALELERGRQFRRIDNDLRRRVNVVAGTLHSPLLGARLAGGRPDGPPGPPRDRSQPNGEFRLPPEAERMFAADGTNQFYYVIQDRDGGTLARSANAPGPELRFGRSRSGNAIPPSEKILPWPPTPQYRGRIKNEPPPGPGARGIRDEALRTWGEFREVEITTPRGERIVVGCSVAAEQRELNRAALKLSAVGGVILLLGLAGGWWISARAIRPIATISEAAAKISEGDLSQRINARETESELGRLAAVLNVTFSRLETAFEQQRQFTSDAAHELRTPVSVILTQTQGTLNRERSPAEYRETLESCQRAAQRMRRLIESLLALARLDAGPVSSRREPLDLARCATDCVELVQPLATERRITIQSQLAEAPCVGDADQLVLVINNLLTNAIHYNRDGGNIAINTRMENDRAVLTVSDNGPGIAPEHLPHIFDRFYRADAARTSSQGRAGLGLAITKAIVEAHGGTIQVASEPGRGSSFEVRLPGDPFP